MATDVLDRLKEEYAGAPADLVPVLQRLQATEGYLPARAMRGVARWLKLSEHEVYGVATFYAQFRFNPPGEHNIKVCLGTACHVAGARNFMEVLKADLDLSHGETTPDGKFSLERVACLGCCALAPVVVVNAEVHGRMNRVKFTDLMKTLKEGGEAAEADAGAEEQEAAAATARPEASE